MKKKNVWMLIVFFGFMCCYLISSAILEGKLRKVADRYIDDACTCFAESANVLFEYYKNNVSYIEIPEFESLNRNELTKITDADVSTCHEILSKRLPKGRTNLGSFVELVDGTFVSSEHEYIKKEIQFTPEQIEIINKFKSEIEQTNGTCVSSVFLYKDTKACFLGQPIINHQNEYIGYKTVICNLSCLEEFQDNYYLDFDIAEIRLTNTDNTDLYVTNKFYYLYNQKNTIKKTVYLEEQEDYLTVCVDDESFFRYFYIYRMFSVVVWMFLIIYLFREVFTSRLTINKTFAYASGVILLVIVWLQGFVYDIVIHNIQVTSNYMQANLCCYKDEFWFKENNDLFLEIQNRENINLWNNDTIKGSVSEYILNKYWNIFENFIDNDKYGEYVYVIDPDGTKHSIREGTNVGFKMNPNWFNYNQYSFNTYYYDKIELQNLDASGTALVLPIVNHNEVKCVICLIYDVQAYVDDMYSLLEKMSNKKLIVDLKGNAYILGTTQTPNIEALEARGSKPYLSSSGIGQYKLIKRLNYKYEGSKTSYYVFDSFYADRRVIFLRENSGKEEWWLVMLITLLVETFLGVCTHIYNRSVIQYSKIDEGTNLTIQNKLQTFKQK